MPGEALAFIIVLYMIIYLFIADQFTDLYMYSAARRVGVA